MEATQKIMYGPGAYDPAPSRQPCHLYAHDYLPRMSNPDLCARCGRPQADLTAGHREMPASIRALVNRPRIGW